jgi:hypothetical protein
MPQPGGLGGHWQTDVALQKQRPLEPHGEPGPPLHSPAAGHRPTVGAQNAIELHAEVMLQLRPSSHEVPLDA